VNKLEYRPNATGFVQDHHLHPGWQRRRAVVVWMPTPEDYLSFKLALKIGTCFLPESVRSGGISVSILSIKSNSCRSIRKVFLMQWSIFQMFFVGPLNVYRHHEQTMFPVQAGPASASR